MTKYFALAAAAITAMGVTSAQAQLITNFDSLNAGDAAVFRVPTLSGSTSANIDPTGAAAAVNTAESSSAPNSYGVFWNWSGTAAADAKLRLTTNNTANFPNPAIDTTKVLRFDAKILTGAIRIALLVRETGGSGPVGSNAGTANSIEIFEPATPVLLDSSVSTDWQSISIDLSTCVLSGFASAGTTTANGIFENGPWGALEAFYITRADAAGVQLFIDNLEIVEPASVGEWLQY